MHQSKVKQIREIKIKDIIIYFVLPLLFIPTIWIIYSIYLRTKIYFLILSIIITYILTRMLALGTVLMYKAFAPLKVRDLCRFEPTCSTYMMIAIKKYGLIIGISMGLHRISRCHYPNGGIDYPQLFKKKKREEENNEKENI